MLLLIPQTVILEPAFILHWPVGMSSPYQQSAVRIQPEI